ncbi:transcriptional regulator GlxA family with amidase domain [Catenuloplanes nepalensis]|uniref:Transcriptional regulator GlxA family with amidase domain n=1 Tax=Catenuloplanes nepalensis TaxID=587533 RepID=A0ABT9N7I8_9ACTN|nr:helix-turn-helix domain-containing protein [Catenuloplanes nepalensis]MDP9799664.1 transcriptional regulator GlxA family with amidase domain [Catenuloplanes nepalensis]
MPSDSRHLVAVLALPGVVPFDLGTAVQLFRSARDADGHRLYRTRVCTPDGRAILAGAGILIAPEDGTGLSLLDAADTIVVPGVDSGPPVEEGTLDPAVTAALRAAHARGARIVSICTASMVLAAAGLLDDRPATTHWWWVDTFRRLYPRVRLNPDVLFVDDGPVLTSAGVAAGIDLCLHIIRTDHGSEVANRTARRCVVPSWREGGQAQFIERPVPVSPAGADTAATRSWALERLDSPLSLPELAGHARMSVRTFTRRFREETGVSPNRWLLQRRLDLARQLLESTSLNVDQIARRCGLGTAASLRQHLHAAIGVAPSAYRRTFSAAARR